MISEIGVLSSSRNRRSRRVIMPSNFLAFGFELAKLLATIGTPDTLA